MKRHRVVITGMGVISPNAHGLIEFERALRDGHSGIRHLPILKELGFSCQLAGVPQGIDALKHQYFSQEALLAMNSSMIYGGIAAIDSWKDAGFAVPAQENNTIDWETGAIIGTGIAGMDTICEVVTPFTNAHTIRKMGSTVVEQTMASSCSAFIGGLFALGGQVSMNSSACTTGTEAIANAYFIIASGRAKRMLAGATEGTSPYTWAPFDAMRVLARGFNEVPTKASRPMSKTAAGFVPGSGAGILVLENLDDALSRGARIYAEILGAHVNCGGQRLGGTMSSPNPIGVQRCIREAIKSSEINPVDIDLINGHLTATKADVLELFNWQKALNCTPEHLPFINSTKSLIGHTLGAAGGIECIASTLELYKGFIHGSINCEDLHPELTPFASRIVHKTKNIDAKILAKSSFGFGDVNGCLILRRWEG